MKLILRSSVPNSKIVLIFCFKDFVFVLLCHILYVTYLAVIQDSDSETHNKQDNQAVINEEDYKINQYFLNILRTLM